MGYSVEKTWNHLDLDDGAGEIVAGVLISGVVGILSGLFTGVPDHEIDAAGIELRRALRESPLLPGTADRVQALLQAQGGPPLVAIPEQMAAELKAHSLTDRDYRPLSGLEIDTVMEIAVYRQCFRASDGINPPMTFDASVHVYLTRVSDGALLFAGPLDYRSRKYRFGKWADHNAKRFRAELERARQTIAESIVEQMFTHPRPGAN
jgi:hypothetical protein